MDELIGTRLGGYVIEAVLGKGGMGVVYRARQVDLDRTVALKLLPPQFTFDAAFVQRFRREARAIAQLNHPHIVQIYDIGQERGSHYYAMEFVEGETLDDRIFRQHRLSVSDAVRIIVQVCRALHAAHEAGIVHRDIKPANIIIDKQGRAKVMDFGIALTQHAERLTSTGGIVGTPEYMSPEQANAGDITPQSDIYSLGIVFYEMLTGEVPFENEQAMVTLQQHVYEEPKPPQALNPDIPLAVQQVMLKMLAKRPEDRYRTCEEIVEDLRAIFQGDAGRSSATKVFSTGASGAPRGAAPRGTRWIPVLAAAALCASGVALWVSMREPELPAIVPMVASSDGGCAPDAEVLVNLISVYEAHARQVAGRGGVVLHLANGGTLVGSDAHVEQTFASLMVPGVGDVVLPPAAVGTDGVERIEPEVDASALMRDSRMQARTFYDTWKLENQEDCVTHAQVPELVTEAANRLPAPPPLPHEPALRAVAAAHGEIQRARADLDTARQEYEALRAGAPEAAEQYADRVVLKSGRTVMCTILDAESDMNALRLETTRGGRMSIPLSEVLYFDRAYGEEADEAARAKTAVATHRERFAAVRARVEAAEAAVEATTAGYAAAVDALLAATQPVEETETSATAPAAGAEETEPAPAAEREATPAPGAEPQPALQATEGPR